jgi:hypothetical protein
MNKTKLLLLTAVATAAVVVAQGPPPPGGGWGRGGPGMMGMGIMGAGPGSRTPVTGAPYSGVQTTEIQQKLADGNTITRQETSKVYRDGQGRVRIEHTTNPSVSSGQTPRTTITIFDPVASASYVLNPTEQTAVKMTLRTPPAGAMAPQRGQDHVQGRGPGGSSAQVQKQDLGTQTINGIAATGTRMTETIAAGAIGNQQAIQIVRETWISTALKVPVLIKSSDPRFGTTSMQLTNIVQAEPEAALFQTPANYNVTTRTEGGGRGPGGMGGAMRGPRPRE